MKIKLSSVCSAVVIASRGGNSIMRKLEAIALPLEEGRGHETRDVRHETSGDDR